MSVERHPTDQALLATALLDGVRGRRALTAVIEDQSRQQTGLPGAATIAPLDAVRDEHLLHLVQQALIDDRRVRAEVARALVHDPPAIDPVLKHQMNWRVGEFSL